MCNKYACVPSLMCNIWEACGRDSEPYQMLVFEANRCWRTASQDVLAWPSTSHLFSGTSWCILKDVMFATIYHSSCVLQIMTSSCLVFKRLLLFFNVMATQLNVFLLVSRQYVILKSEFYCLLVLLLVIVVWSLPWLNKSLITLCHRLESLCSIHHCCCEQGSKKIEVFWYVDVSNF